MVKQEKIYSPKEDGKELFWKTPPDVDLKKVYEDIKRILDNTEVSEEEIKNHYNVYVYNLLPYPPKKKDKIDYSG